MTQAANEAQAAPAMTQEQRTIIQQSHQIANLSAMLDTAMSQRNQLGAIVKNQAAALDEANKVIEALKASPPTLAPADASRAKPARRKA